MVRRQCGRQKHLFTAYRYISVPLTSDRWMQLEQINQNAELRPCLTYFCTTEDRVFAHGQHLKLRCAVSRIKAVKSAPSFLCLSHAACETITHDNPLAAGRTIRKLVGFQLFGGGGLEVMNPLHHSFDTFSPWCSVETLSRPGVRLFKPREDGRRQSVVCPGGLYGFIGQCLVT